MFTVVRQTDFTAAKGNALQACVASLRQLQLEDVPNFIVDPEGYMTAISRWLATQKLTFVKVNLDQDGTIPSDTSPFEPQCYVILRGKSPRGDFGHVVVAQVDATGRQFHPVMDPHPSNDNIDGPGQWAGAILPL
ncbi:hypothetical protein THRCLA_22512 [Thraustotheca clavata]|uniref:Uncharacterized protein n=1 Tax=Thraustotheca clavata TaxID=74557 RepID=A0A1V9YYP9_9STRA|nr:hypothetical protein THRCLA_22512 [Thraustotheca clavata]